MDCTEIANKLDFIENKISKEIFENPIRENLIDLRKDLLDFAETFQKEINEFGGKYQVSQPNVSSEADKVNIEKLEYRIKHLLRSFDNYQNQAKEQIRQLQEQKAKDDYRINILLNTISELENKNKLKDH